MRVGRSVKRIFGAISTIFSLFMHPLKAIETDTVCCGSLIEGVKSWQTGDESSTHSSLQKKPLYFFHLSLCFSTSTLPSFFNAFFYTNSYSFICWNLNITGNGCLQPSLSDHTLNVIIFTVSVFFLGLYFHTIHLSVRGGAALFKSAKRELPAPYRFSHT